LWNGTYIPVVLPQMAKSTRDRYQGIIRNYLRPQFGALCLREISVLSVDRYLAGLRTTKLHHESLDKVRDVLSSICGSAVRYGLLVTNPVEGVRLLHRTRGKRCRPWVTQEQFFAVLDLICGPYASMVFVGVFSGLRVSELVGLRWRNIGLDSISIEERYCRGDWGAPKSAASNATIPVDRAVIERIHRLKTVTLVVKAGRGTRRFPAVKACGPEDLVFQSVQKRPPGSGQQRSGSPHQTSGPETVFSHLQTSTIPVWFHLVPKLKPGTPDSSQTHIFKTACPIRHSLPC
jgi:integrase